VTTPGLILREILHRKTNFLLSVLAVTVAVALFISFFTAGVASQRETARLMLQMGYNLHIVPEGTDRSEFLLTGLTDKTMPQQYLEKLATPSVFSYNHLLGTLQRRISWQGFEVVLAGLAPEVCPPGQKQPPMVEPIPQGTAYVGYIIADRLKLKAGQIIEIAGKQLKIVRCLFEQGGVDDIRIQCHLKDAQEILNLPGRISEIQAVDCICFIDTNDPVSILRKEVASILPDVQVVQAMPIAMARAKQRQMIQGVFAVIVPFVVIVCGIWIGVLAAVNVRDRYQEIGIMRALGYGSGKITTLFLGKAVIVGLLGAFIGFLVGTYLALHFGPEIFKMTAKTVMKPQLSLLAWSLIFAPLFAAVTSFIPAMIAVAYDPAVALRQE
jgi:ABC-type lipoprotein release transport system permease subunit